MRVNGVKLPTVWEPSEGGPIPNIHWGFLRHTDGDRTHCQWKCKVPAELNLLPKWEGIKSQSLSFYGPFISTEHISPCMASEVNSLSRARLFATPWTVARQAPLSTGFSRQEYWSGLPFPSTGESSQPRNRTHVSRMAGRCFILWATRELSLSCMVISTY